MGWACNKSEGIHFENVVVCDVRQASQRLTALQAHGPRALCAGLTPSRHFLTPTPALSHHFPGFLPVFAPFLSIFLLDSPRFLY